MLALAPSSGGHGRGRGFRFDVAAPRARLSAARQRPQRQARLGHGGLQPARARRAMRRRRRRKGQGGGRSTAAARNWRVLLAEVSRLPLTTANRGDAGARVRQPATTGPAGAPSSILIVPSGRSQVPISRPLAIACSRSASITSSRPGVSENGGAPVEREDLEGIAVHAMPGRRVGWQPGRLQVGVASDVQGLPCPRGRRWRARLRPARRRPPAVRRRSHAPAGWAWASRHPRPAAPASAAPAGTPVHCSGGERPSPSAV